jgi:hypothetical protein
MSGLQLAATAAPRSASLPVAAIAQGFNRAARQFAERLPDIDPNLLRSRQKYGRRVEFRARYRGFQLVRPAEPRSFEHWEPPNRIPSKSFSHAVSLGHETS